MSDEEQVRADAWDLGYDTAMTLLEAGILRLATEGKSALKGMKRATNPYRRTGATS